MRNPAPDGTYLTLPQASQALGRIGRDNTITHPQTIKGWIVRGVGLQGGGREYLEGIRGPGGWLTTREALDRFFAVLTADRLGRPLPDGTDTRPATAPAVRTPARRARDIAEAAAEVIEMGA
jgi:hypothetical protein